jgi:hypothetical protein
VATPAHQAIPPQRTLPCPHRSKTLLGVTHPVKLHICVARQIRAIRNVCHLFECAYPRSNRHSASRRATPLRRPPAKANPDLWEQRTCLSARRCSTAARHSPTPSRRRLAQLHASRIRPSFRTPQGKSVAECNEERPRVRRRPRQRDLDVGIE